MKISMCFLIICSTYFYQICLVFLLKPSGTLTEIIVEISHEVRKKREITGATHPGWLNCPCDLWIHPLPLWRNGAGLKVSIVSKILSWLGSSEVLVLTQNTNSAIHSKPTESEFSGEGRGAMHLTESPGDPYPWKDEKQRVEQLQQPF